MADKRECCIVWKNVLLQRYMEKYIAFVTAENRVWQNPLSGGSWFKNKEGCYVWVWGS